MLVSKRKVVSEWKVVEKKETCQGKGGLSGEERVVSRREGC